MALLFFVIFLFRFPLMNFVCNRPNINTINPVIILSNSSASAHFVLNSFLGKRAISSTKTALHRPRWQFVFLIFNDDLENAFRKYVYDHKAPVSYKHVNFHLIIYLFSSFIIQKNRSFTMAATRLHNIPYIVLLKTSY